MLNGEKSMSRGQKKPGTAERGPKTPRLRERCKCGGEIKSVHRGTNGQACWRVCSSPDCTCNEVFHVKATRDGRQKKVVVHKLDDVPVYVAANVEVMRAVVAG